MGLVALFLLVGAWGVCLVDGGGIGDRLTLAARLFRAALEMTPAVGAGASGVTTREGTMKTTMMIVSVVALAAPVGFGQVTLVSQPREAFGFAGISVTTGNNVFGFANRRLADNFGLGGAVGVETVRWWGGSETSAGDSLSNLSGFEIAVFADDGGLPGTAVFVETVSLADANPQQIPGEQQGLLQAAMYGFEADLSSAQSLAAGDYWISIAGIAVNPVDFTNEAFQWVESNPPGDGTIAQDRFDGDGFQLRTLSATDFAFELVGIPAPGSVALLGFAGVAATRRRR